MNVSISCNTIWFYVFLHSGTPLTSSPPSHIDSHALPLPPLWTPGTSHGKSWLGAASILGTRSYGNLVFTLLNGTLKHVGRRGDIEKSHFLVWCSLKPDWVKPENKKKKKHWAIHTFLIFTLPAPNTRDFWYTVSVNVWICNYAFFFLF